eukprot:11688341-Prorocentrum_lima.AAC.1
MQALPCCGCSPMGLMSNPDVQELAENVPMVWDGKSVHGMHGPPYPTPMRGVRETRLQVEAGSGERESSQ